MSDWDEEPPKRYEHSHVHEHSLDLIFLLVIFLVWWVSLAPRVDCSIGIQAACESIKADYKKGDSK